MEKGIQAKDLKKEQRKANRAVRQKIQKDYLKELRDNPANKRSLWLNFIAFFYCSALLGVMNKWLDSNMKEDFEDIVDKTGFLFDNNITQAIKLISENNL